MIAIFQLWFGHHFVNIECSNFDTFNI